MTARVLAGGLPYEPDSVADQQALADIEADTTPDTTASAQVSGPDTGVAAPEAADSGADTTADTDTARTGVVTAGGQPWTGGSRRPARWQDRLTANVAALEVLATLEQEARPATEAEQETLAGWSAWGALPFVFDEADERVATQDRERVRELLGPVGWSQARATTLNAHYTDPAVAEAMWSALESAGFEDGAVLEPGCGSGEFMGAAPAGAQMVGVELDETTARVAAYLHPDQQVMSAGFEKTMFPENSFSAAVGNVPFGGYSVVDKTHNGQGHSIHNHFILKSLRLTAPGGYVAVMTSTHTMDAKRETARREMARYADLVGAVRLPNGAMAASAGTDVKTDVLVFRRRKPTEKVDQERVAGWVEADTLAVRDPEGNEHEVSYSKWFKDHPERVVGEAGYASSAFGPTYAVRVEADVDVAEQVEVLLTEQMLDARFGGSSALSYAPEVAEGVAVDTSPGLRFAPEPEAQIGHVRHNAGGWFEQYRAGLTWERVKIARPLFGQAKSLLAMRDKATEVLAAQRTGAPEAEREQLRAELRGLWESYVGYHGPISRGEDKYGPPSKADRDRMLRELETQWRDSLPQDGDVAPADVPVPEDLAAEWLEAATASEFKKREQKHLEFLAGDPKLGLIRSLEVYDEATNSATPAPIMTRDVVQHRTRPERAESVEDAIAVSMDESRTVDVGRVAELLGVDRAQARERMSGEVFQVPGTEELVPKTTYLSGNVRAKLAAAREAAQADAAFRENVAALEAVVPAEIALADVSVNPGVRWVPEDVYAQFVSETLKAQCQVRLNPGTDAWEIEVPKGGVAPEVRYRWGVEKRTPAQLMTAAMNMKTVTVTVELEEGKRIKDEKATAAARAKVEEIRAEFGVWMMQDPARVERLQGLYNDAFNAHVAPDYSGAGARLSLPGLNESMTPYSYQRAAVARAVSEPTVLLDHVVGAGKTGTMIMSAMELKRTGIVAKPCMVVPNHLVDQIATEATQWYPDANVIAVPTGLAAPARQEWMAQVGAGDWDLVVMPQTTFEKVQIDPVKQAEWLKQAQDELEAATAGQDQDAGWVKRSEKAKKALERQHGKIAANTDPGVTFEETGIDYLLVDEAHMFKNLARSSDLAELACSGSQRAMDLDFKLRALREVKTEAAERAGVAGPGYLPAVATFATGTPVANNMAEMWVMQHYLRPDLLEAARVDTVTAWGQAFTKVKPQLRPTVTGDGYQQVIKVAEYVNVPELLSINSTFTGVVLRDQLETTLPSVATGDRILMARPPSEQVAQYVDQLKERIEAVKNSPPVKGGDNMLVIVGDGRKVALDPRLVGLPADPDGGRVAAVAEQIMTIHERTKDTEYRLPNGEVSETTGALQIVFCDQSTPTEDGSWNVYDQLREDLAARGMDPEKVAFIHEAKTDEARAALFEKCRDGRVNVIIGSTQKMGTGTNIQTRAIALHHMDVPWRPADLEQREGRIIRQGNQNAEVSIYAWATEQTFDVYSWDMIARKATFIAQVKAGQLNGRTMEDVVAGLEVSGASAAAVLSGDPRIEQLATLSMDVEQLTRAQSAWSQQRATQRVELGRYEARQEFLAGRQNALIGLAAQVSPTAGDAFAFTTTDGQTIRNRGEAGEVLVAELRRQAARTDRTDFLNATDPESLGTLGGVEVGTVRHASQVYLVPMQAPSVRRAWSAAQVLGGEVSAQGSIISAENFVAELPSQLVKDKRELDQLAETIPAMQEGLAESRFQQADELVAKQRELAALEAEMSDDVDESLRPAVVEYTADQLNERGLLGHHTVPHEGDVWEYNKGFYIVGYTDKSVGADQRQLWAWPVDGDPKDAFGASKLQSRGRMVVRRESGLNEIERRAMQADLDRDRIVPNPRMALGYDGEVLRERIDRAVAKGRLDAEGNMIESSTGALIRDEEFVRFGSPVILIDATTPEAEQARRDAIAERAYTRWPDELIPGQVLQEDIAGFGYAGDIVRMRPGYGERRVAVSPDTGAARERLSGSAAAGAQRWQVSDAVQLSDAEREKLWGAKTRAMQVGDLRPGDTVMATDVDTSATTKVPVTILKTGSGGNRDIVYADQDGAKQECRRRDTTMVTVLGRTRGALELPELATLAAEAGQPVKACPARRISPDSQWVGRTLAVDTAADRMATECAADGLKVGTVIAQDSRTIGSAYSGTEEVALLTLRDEAGGQFQVTSRDSGHVWEVEDGFDAAAVLGGRGLAGSAPDATPRPDTVSVTGQVTERSGQCASTAGQPDAATWTARGHEVAARPEDLEHLFGTHRSEPGTAGPSI